MKYHIGNMSKQETDEKDLLFLICQKLNDISNELAFYNENYFRKVEYTEEETAQIEALEKDLISARKENNL